MRKTANLLTVAAMMALGACSMSNPDARQVSDPFANSARPVRAEDARLTRQTEQDAMIAQFRAQAGDTVLFPNDDTNLTPQARQTLTRQAAWLAGNLGWLALIEGHAAENGTREYNLSLGARRASSVQDYLIAKGVAPERIRTVSFGKERPVQPCTTEACHDVNRRAVTVLQPAGMI